MAEWYVGSVHHAAIAQWAATTAYSVGDIRRQLAAPAVGSERAFRCTTAGTSGGAEPSWNLTKGATTNDGTAVWTEVTGNSTYGWSAAAARLLLMFNTFAAAGDTIYVAQNHAETQAASMTLTSAGTSALPLSIYCVDAAGSVPPVAADLRTTATVTTTGANNMTVRGYAYIYGIGFSCGSGAVNADMLVNNSSASSIKFEACSLSLPTTGSGSDLSFGLSASSQCAVELVNTTISFGATGQGAFFGPVRFTWRDTPSALGGTVPTSLFILNGPAARIILEGVDLSAAGAGKNLFASPTGPIDVSINNCEVHASVTYCTAPSTRGGVVADLLISDSGANTYRQERLSYEGALTTETTHVLSGGASDGVTPISWKIVTTSTALRNFPFGCPPIAIWNDSVGAPVTATIEIENGGLTLTDADVWVEFEYLGDSGAPRSLRASTAPATPLTSGANLPTSSATWSGGLGGAVKQYMQATFTPEIAGLIRATVKVARASTTLYLNPQITLS